MCRLHAAPARICGGRYRRPGALSAIGTSGVSASQATITPGRAGLRTHPVIEIFGPTIQGEGAEAGLPTHFVRFGGCDYRCVWCDTMYAVDPAIVRSTSRRLTTDEIIAEL